MSLNILDNIINIYNKTVRYPKLLRYLRLDSIVRHTLVRVVQIFPHQIVKVKKAVNGQNSPRIVVSLTTYPARINNTWKTITSLINQSLVPDKIILWLSKEQFDGEQSLPTSLLSLKKYGLEIRFVDNDYRSHKKYLYAFREFQNDYVMLADDDILYPSDTLYELHKDIDSKCVHCSYGYKIGYNSDGSLRPYNQWKHVCDNYAGSDFFFGSGGGTMLMPASLPVMATDIQTAISLCPLADDVWLNAMARAAKLAVRKVRWGYTPFPTNPQSNDTLTKYNVGNSQNDIQICNIQTILPNSFEKYAD